MNAPEFIVTYIKDGERLTNRSASTADYSIEYSTSEKSFTAELEPNADITLVKVDAVFDYDFTGKKFYSNGYQAWTTSKEYKKDEFARGITPLAKGNLKKFAGLSADCRFVKEPSRPGEFLSHTYTYIRTGNGIELMGSLSEKNGFTVFYADMNRNTLTFSKDVEGVTPQKTVPIFDIAFESGAYDDVFDAYFSRMNISKPRIDRMTGYTSWYNYFQKINEKIILRDLNALDCVRDSVSIFQIDDGFETFVGDWLDENPEKFPHGMKYIAEKIHEKGYSAGLWLAPFNVQIKSRTYREHPDWVIRDKNGEAVLGCAGWGGAYTMDIYNEEVRAYIKHFFDVILNDWQFDMVKLDFLYSQCMYPRNGKSRGTIMCEAMEFLRECCGDKLILGCGVPLGAAFGYVDACRTGCDVDLAYKGKFYNKLHINREIPSAQNSINNAVFRRHLNGRAFCNDPDVFFLRYSNLKFTTRQKLLLGGINHLFGGVLFVSDNAEEYRHEDVKALKKFFSHDSVKVLSCDEENGIFTIDAEINGEERIIIFDIISGDSNLPEILGLSAVR